MGRGLVATCAGVGAQRRGCFSGALRRGRSSPGAGLLSVGFDVVAGCLVGVLGRVRVVSVSEVGMMSGCVVVAGFVMLRGFRVMVGGHSMVVGGLAVMVRCLF